MESDFSVLFKELSRLRQQSVNAVIEYAAPEVHFIISHTVTDEKRIEQTLDSQVLELFKKLCRHYYFLNQEAAVWYLNQYRALYDYDCKQQGD